MTTFSIFNNLDDHFDNVGKRVEAFGDDLTSAWEQLPDELLRGAVETAGIDGVVKTVGYTTNLTSEAKSFLSKAELLSQAMVVSHTDLLIKATGKIEEGKFFDDLPTTASAVLDAVPKPADIIGAFGDVATLGAPLGVVSDTVELAAATIGTFDAKQDAPDFVAAISALNKNVSKLSDLIGSDAPAAPAILAQIDDKASLLNTVLDTASQTAPPALANVLKAAAPVDALEDLNRRFDKLLTLWGEIPGPTRETGDLAERGREAASDQQAILTYLQASLETFDHLLGWVKDGVSAAIDVLPLGIGSSGGVGLGAGFEVNGGFAIVGYGKVKLNGGAGAGLSLSVGLVSITATILNCVTTLLAFVQLLVRVAISAVSFHRTTPANVMAALV